EKSKGKKNKGAMRNIVNSGEIPGLLAYSDGKPVGWCSVAPRERFPSLNDPGYSNALMIPLHGQSSAFLLISVIEIKGLVLNCSRLVSNM
ncbi:MAG TPA: hypothetical protein VFF49_06395, partial [Thermodesulfobacteriota bacterium]|nr:hypothetical protein [Thermodesulfobacteriota bacterium]